MAKQTIRAFFLIVAVAVSANSQETNTSQQQATTSQQQTSASQDTPSSAQPAATPAYVFPDNRERFRRYVKSTIGPFSLLRTTASAGIEQANDSPEEWEQGAKGYGKRFASGLGRNVIQQTVTYGLDEALDLDTGFERSTRNGFFPRLKDALLQNVTSRTRSGKRVISAPRLAGVYTGGIIAAEAWYPERYSYKDGLRSGTRALLTGFGINIVREFVVNW
jgi:hypothetical protein